MSDTPRTDELIAELDANHEVAIPFVWRQMVNLARQLESALAAMTAQRDKAERERGTLLATEQGPTPIGQMLSDMEQRALASEARALAMEKDAERYRWMKAHAVWGPHDQHRAEWYLPWARGPLGEQLDAAIDASRARA